MYGLTQTDVGSPVNLYIFNFYFGFDWAKAERLDQCKPEINATYGIRLHFSL